MQTAKAISQYDQLDDSARWATRILSILVVPGLILVSGFAATGAHRPDPESTLIFLRLFTIGEPIPLLALALWLAIFAWSAVSAPCDPRQDSGTLARGHHRLLVWLIALSAGMVSLIVGRATGQGIGFSADEYAALLQADFLRQGSFTGTIPTEWLPLREGVTPVFVFEGQESTEWVYQYIPGYAILVYLAGMLDAVALLNPILNALTVVLVAEIAEKRWSNRQDLAILATMLIATSQQFLLTGGSQYSMPAHLMFNSLWLFGYVTGPRSVIWMGPVGAFASLLHQPIPHPLFVAPFLLRMLREKRIGALVYLSLWYTIAIVCFVFWRKIGGAIPASILGLPKMGNVVVLLMNVILIATWNAPVVAWGLLVAIRNMRSLDCIDLDLLFGIVAVLLFFLTFVPVTQGHGWGWRYGHQVLVNIVLLATTGWSASSKLMEARHAKRMLTCSFLVSLLVLVPWRTAVAYRIVKPFSNAVDWMSKQEEHVLVIPADSIWYGRDLIRNHPSMRKPVTLRGSSLAGSDTAAIPEPWRTSVRWITVEELEALGLERVDRVVPGADR